MDTTKKRILVVEDEKELRELYVDILKQEGYEVDFAADGEEGYKVMLKGGYDLVLLDLMLPIMDGFQILEKLKTENQPEKPNRSIVILTNLGQDLTITKGISYGVRGYLIKSDYTPDQILKEIKDYLV